MELFEEEQIDKLRIKHQRENTRLQKKYSKITDKKYENDLLTQGFATKRLSED